MTSCFVVPLAAATLGPVSAMSLSPFALPAGGLSMRPVLKPSRAADSMQDDKAGQDVLRFAPSPNGWLHLGHAYSALFAHEMAQRLGARFLLRIEDIDIGRCRPEHEEAIYDDLRWLGLDWEAPVRRQSEQFAEYERHPTRLRDMG